MDLVLNLTRPDKEVYNKLLTLADATRRICITEEMEQSPAE